MKNDYKNSLFAHSNWLAGFPVDTIADELAGTEQYLTGDNQPRENNHEAKLPEEIGILPIRNTVAYPGTVTPLAIGRERSRALLADTKPNESIIGLVTQQNPQTDRPGFETTIQGILAGSPARWDKR